MIKAGMFDLDNTLIDFMRMKKGCCRAAVSAMKKAGLRIDRKKALKIMFDLYNADSLIDIISSPHLRSEEQSIMARYHSQRVCGIEKIA